MTVSTVPGGGIESILLRLQEPVIDAMVRVLVGAITVPVALALQGSDASLWSVVAVFLALLVSLRLIPAVARKVLPFSRAAVAAWQRERHLAKLHDSYQWRKLLWFGLGIAAYTTMFGELRRADVILASACLLAGISGQLVWHRAGARPAYVDGAVNDQARRG
jgi:hypothetical protein